MTGRRVGVGGPSGRGTIRRSSCWLCWRVYCPPAQARQYCPAVEHPPPARAGLFCEATLRAAALRADTPWIGRRVLAPPIDKGARRSKSCAMLNWRSLGAAEMPFTASSDLGGQLWPRSCGEHGKAFEDHPWDWGARRNQTRSCREVHFPPCRDRWGPGFVDLRDKVVVALGGPTHVASKDG
jgi:hypothetical protein